MEPNFNPYTPPTEFGGQNHFFQNKVKPNYFEAVAFGLAIASLLSCTVIYTAYLFGGLAILFALLSRGAQMNFTRKSKLSLIIGIGGIILSTVLFVVTFIILLEEYGSLEGILRAGSEMLGIDFEEEFGILFQ